MHKIHKFIALGIVLLLVCLSALSLLTLATHNHIHEECARQECHLCAFLDALLALLRRLSTLLLCAFALVVLPFLLRESQDEHARTPAKRTLVVLKVRMDC